MDEMLTIADAGRELGLTPGGTRWLAETGRLRVAARTPGGLRLFLRVDVQELRLQRERGRTGGTSRNARQ